MPFDNWKARLRVNAEHSTVAARRAAIAALKINHSQPTEADEGYYRKPITEPVIGADGKTNGQKRVIGWTGAAYFIHDGKLVGLVGSRGKARSMKPEEITDEELWSYVVANPIPYAWWLAVVERGEPWPDEPVAGTRTQENTPEPASDAPADPPHIAAAKAADAQISAAASLTIDSEEAVAIADGSKNRMAELRLRTDKQGRAIYDPMYAAYTAERDKWLPTVNRLSVAEKAIASKILTFRNAERKRIAEEAAAAAAAQAALDEANERAAQRAIANGLPEPPPEVPEEPPASTMPPPTPAAPTYGKRQTKGKLQKFAVIEDQAKVYEFFKGNEQVVSLLQSLATNAIRAGVEVPGTTTEEKLA